MNMDIYDLKCEHLKNPIGIDCRAPLFSWKLKSNERNTMQIAYRVIVAKSAEDLTKKANLVWDSGIINTDSSIHIKYSGQPLEAKLIYHWSVMIWDNHDEYAESQSQTFETAMLNQADWTAKWVEPRQEPTFAETVLTIDEFMRYPSVPPEEIAMRPSQYLRKSILIKKCNPVKARIYITAHGIYRLFINGTRVSMDEFTPGNTSYHDYLQYQVYDILPFLNDGENVIGVILADGWYLGRVGFGGDSCQFGNMLGLLFQMELVFSDGSTEIFVSDESLKSSTGPLVFSDIFVGEKYDARLELTGWDNIGFDDESWVNVDEADYPKNNLKAQYGESVRGSECFFPKSIYQSPKNETIIDLGQVIAGRVTMRITDAKKGDRITLEHSEIVNKDGSFLNNIQGRYKNQMDIYICKGEKEEVYEPYFTFHGFRYIKVTGYTGELKPEHINVVVLRSDMEITGEFNCSDNRLNQLQSNILWSQKGNFLSIPTDCPQRERVGWTGDVQVFCPTAVYNMDTLAFFKRWLNNMRADQKPDGQVPTVVPYIKAYQMETGCFPMQDTHCSAGWGDACIILPWVLYRSYGDKSVLSDNYHMMRQWVEYIRRTAETENPEDVGKVSPERRERLKYLWNTHFHFADWLTPSVSFDFETGDVDMIKSAYATKDYVPTCFYAYSTYLLSQIAGILGHESDAVKYAALSGKVKKAFADEFVDENGRIDTPLQGIYILALKFGLIPEHLREKAMGHLIALIEKNGNKLDTGFLSGPHILDVLTDGGHLDIAWALLFQEECPSWLYEVKMGATTIWEAWQAVLPDGTPTTVSFNHYAFGCVGDWMYRNIAGIHSVKEGYKQIEIKPLFTERITSAYGRLETGYGTLISDWVYSENGFELSVTIPANTNAKISFPDLAFENIWESGDLLTRSDTMNTAGDEPRFKVSVGSGQYRFVAK